MDINTKINEIIKVENDIAILYSNLYETELSGDKNGCMYSHYINSLKDALREEQVVFSNFNFDSLNKIFNYIEKNKNKLVSRFAPSRFNEFVIDRVVKRIQDHILISLDLKNDETLNKCNPEFIEDFKNKIKMEKIISLESEDIYLSFLDEYIPNCDDIRVKQELIFDKYFSTYKNTTDYEKMMIYREFNVDSSLYLNSEILISLEGLNIDKFYNLKNMASASLVSKVIENLFSRNLFFTEKYTNYLEEAERIRNLLEIRSCCLLMDNATFDSFITTFKENSTICDKMNEIFNLDMINTLKKDRERHKYLSLKRK